LVYVFGVRLDGHKTFLRQICLRELFQTYAECGWLKLQDLIDLCYQFGLQEEFDEAHRSVMPITWVSLAIGDYVYRDITQFYQPRPFTIDHLRRVMTERDRLNKERSRSRPAPP
jgi:hypothetical protein